jgi:hypothetical protein
MDLYILDERLRRTEVLDKYESLIWTDRYAVCGDFEFLIHSTPYHRSLLVEGTMLAILASKHVMVIETIEDADSEGRSMLKVSGRSLEGIAEERIARDTLSNLTIAPRWPIVGTPGNIARR